MEKERPTYKFSSELIKDRREKKKLSYRCLSGLTKDVDPEGDGVTAMTCSRIELIGADPKASTIFMICGALGISPRSTFIKEDMEEDVK